MDNMPYSWKPHLWHLHITELQSLNNWKILSRKSRGGDYTVMPIFCHTSSFFQKWLVVLYVALHPKSYCLNPAFIAQPCWHCNSTSHLITPYTTVKAACPVDVQFH